MAPTDDRAPRAGARAVRVGGETLWLLAERAAWWAAESTLVVSDLHLGRAPDDAPTPGEATSAAAEDLGRIGELVDALGATRLWILGDLRHATAPHLTLADDVLATWLASRAELDVLLIRGNQDLAAGDAAFGAILTIDDAGRRAGPFTLHHYPPEADDPSAVAPGWLAGHLHPAATVGGPREARRSPAFLLEGRGLVLPAFGSGARPHPVRRRPRQSLLGIVDGAVGEPVDLGRS